MKPLVVSYYTKDTPYEKEAVDLIASCIKFNLDYEIIPIDSLGSWSANCCYKPKFLLNCLEKHHRPLIWTDCDSVFVKEPAFFFNCKKDIALRTHKNLPVDAKSKILTGTLFINNNATVKKLLRIWKKECDLALKTTPLLFDQAVLAKILFQGSLKVSLEELPRGYLEIVDHRDSLLTPKEEVVVVHTQASRILQKIIDGEVTPNLTNWLNSQELKKIRTNPSD